MVRVAVSLKNRHVPPEVVVQRLASAGPADRLSKALTAYGRIIKTIYILRYIHEEELRRPVQLQLNRGEHRHTLAKWICFANRREFRDGDLNEINELDQSTTRIWRGTGRYSMPTSSPMGLTTFGRLNGTP